MKKFYTTGLAVLTVALCTASAGATEVVKRNANLSNAPVALMSPAQAAQAVKVGAHTATELQALTGAAPAAKAPAKAPAKVVAKPTSIETLLATQFDATYFNPFDGQNVSGESGFKYYEQYEELDLIVPSTDISDEIYCDFDDQGRVVFYSKVKYADNFSGYVLNLITAKMNAAGTNLEPMNANVTMEFDEKTSSYVLPEGAYLAYAGYNTTGTYLGCFWAAGDLKVSAVEGDFALEVLVEDECTPDNKFNFLVTAGKDVASVKMLLLGYDGDLSSHASYITSLGSAIELGKEFTVDPVNDHVLASQNGPMDESSFAAALFAAYDADGNQVKTRAVPLVVVLETEEGWRDVATVDYEDQILSNIFTNVTHSQSGVKLQEKTDAPGLFRYVNAYSQHLKAHSDDCPHYFIINTADPEWVEVPFSVTGTDHGYGTVTFGSRAALGYDKESAQAKGFKSGTMNGYTATFPAQTLFFHMSQYNAASSWSYVSSKNEISFTFPTINVELTLTNQGGEPIEGVEVTFDNEATAQDDTATPTVYTSDANGKVTAEMPFGTGYFGTVKGTYVVRKQDGTAYTNPFEVQLGGAQTQTTVTTSAPQGIEMVEAGTEAPVYYNLQGVQVERPQGICIRVQGGKAQKVLVK